MTCKGTTFNSPLRTIDADDNTVFCDTDISTSSATDGQFLQYNDVAKSFIPVTLASQETYDTIIIVKQASDFGTIDPDKTYFIDGAIDMGAIQIQVPEGGISIYSDDLNLKGLFSTEDNYTMFVQADGASYTGNITFQNMFLYTSGANSKLGMLDNDGNNSAFECTNVNFGTFGSTSTEFFELSDYRQHFFSGCAFIRYATGFTFNGNSSGLVANSSIVLSGQANSVLFKAGASLLFSASIRSDINFLSVDATSVLMDFSAPNIVEDDSLRLTNVRSSATNAMPNIAGNSVKALYRFCEGILDTYLGGRVKVDTGATTNIVTVNTPVKMAGSTSDSDLSHFDTNSLDNRLRYISANQRNFKIGAIGSFSGGNNDVMNFIIKHFNSSDVLIADIDTQSATLNGGATGTRAENINAIGFATMSEGDYIELWVENITDSSDITTITGTQFIIQER